MNTFFTSPELCTREERGEREGEGERARREREAREERERGARERERRESQRDIERERAAPASADPVTDNIPDLFSSCFTVLHPQTPSHTALHTDKTRTLNLLHFWKTKENDKSNHGKQFLPFLFLSHPTHTHTHTHRSVWEMTHAPAHCFSHGMKSV